MHARAQYVLDQLGLTFMNSIKETHFWPAVILLSHSYGSLIALLLPLFSLFITLWYLLSVSLI